MILVREMLWVWASREPTIYAVLIGSQRRCLALSGKQSWDTNRELSGLPQLNLN